MEKIFGISRGATQLVILSTIIIGTGMLIKIIKPEPDAVWQVVKDGEYFITKDAVETGRCVDFTDENGLPHTFCGRYKMIKI